MEKFSAYSDKYALVRIHGEFGYGHMDAYISNMVDSYGTKPTIKVTSQIGGETTRDGSDPVYAWAWGMSNDMSVTTVYEMEQMIKVMNKITRRLKAMDDQLGRATTFYEYMARILISSGVEHVFINKEFGGSLVGRELTDLPWFNPTDKKNQGALRDALRMLQDDLVRKFVPSKGE